MTTWNTWNFTEELRGNRDGLRRRVNRDGTSKKLDELMLKVMQGGMTLREVRLAEPVLYGRNIDKFKKWRADYMVAKSPPRVRVNHYIGGSRTAQQLGRTGKSVLARLLAVALYPDLDPDEAYFEATDKRAPLQNYAGQPVIIWDDFLPVELLEALGGRGGVLKAFDVHPGRLDANIKNSVAALRHEVNILTRAMHYGAYFDALAGEYVGRDGTQHTAEAPEQFWGRFTFAHEVTPSDISVLVSQAAVEDTQEFRDFQKIMGLRVGMRQLVTRLDEIEDEGERTEAHLEIGRRVLGPVLDQQAEICAPATRTKDDVLAELLPVIDGALLGPAELAAEERAAQETKAAAAAAEVAQIEVALDAADGDFFTLYELVSPGLRLRAKAAAIARGWVIDPADEIHLAQHTFGHIGMPPHVINPAHINSN